MSEMKDTTTEMKDTYYHLGEPCMRIKGYKSVLRNASANTCICLDIHEEVYNNCYDDLLFDTKIDDLCNYECIEKFCKDMSYDNEYSGCIANEHKCVCYNQACSKGCRALKHTCICDDIYGECAADEHKCMCSEQWGFCRSKDHECACPAACMAIKHSCICGTGSSGSAWCFDCNREQT